MSIIFKVDEQHRVMLRWFAIYAFLLHPIKEPQLLTALLLSIVILYCSRILNRHPSQQPKNAHQDILTAQPSTPPLAHRLLIFDEK